jgi:hypothetical protein
MISRVDRTVVAAAMCALAALAVSACSGGGAATATNPDAAADQQTGTVSFAADIYPVIASTCLEAGCHDMAVTINHWSDFTIA